MAFFVYGVRLQHGGIGGFHKQVKKLRSRNKRLPEILMLISVIFIVFFGFFFFSLMVAGMTWDEKHITKSANDRYQIMNNNLVSIKAKINSLNTSKHSNYYSEGKEYEFFNLADLMNEKASG